MADSLQEAHLQLERWDPQHGIAGLQDGLAALAGEIAEEDGDEALQELIATGIDGIRDGWARRLEGWRRAHEDVRDALGELPLHVSEVLTRVRREAASEPKLWDKADKRLARLGRQAAASDALKGVDEAHGLAVQRDVVDGVAWVRTQVAALGRRAGGGLMAPVERPLARYLVFLCAAIVVADARPQRAGGPALSEDKQRALQGTLAHYLPHETDDGRRALVRETLSPPPSFSGGIAFLRRVEQASQRLGAQLAVEERWEVVQHLARIAECDGAVSFPELTLLRAVVAHIGLPRPHRVDADAGRVLLPGA